MLRYCARKITGHSPLTFDLWPPKSNLFIFESGWTFEWSLKKKNSSKRSWDVQTFSLGSCCWVEALIKISFVTFESPNKPFRIELKLKNTQVIAWEAQQSLQTINEASSTALDLRWSLNTQILCFPINTQPFLKVWGKELKCCSCIWMESLRTKDK